MNETIWVQHISGKGEKWEVAVTDDYTWVVNVPHFTHRFSLPKSDYKICDPPERWVDVTDDCVVQEQPPERAGVRHCGPGNSVLMIYGGYRLRKVSYADRAQWAFIVERQVSP